eukprot:gene22350-8814_t
MRAPRRARRPASPAAADARPHAADDEGTAPGYGWG